MVGDLEKLTRAIKKNEELKKESLRTVIVANQIEISEALRKKTVIRLALPDGRILVITPPENESAAESAA